MLGGDICLVIAGNKIDLEKQRTVPVEEADEYVFDNLLFSNFKLLLMLFPKILKLDKRSLIQTVTLCYL